MSFASYKSRKDSGFAWLGEIPSHWKVIQSRRIFLERKERARLGDERLTASQKHGILTQREFADREGHKVMQVITGMDILKHVEPNDFVISMRSFQGGLEHSSVAGCVSSAYVMVVPASICRAAFYRYLFKSSSYIRALQSTSNLVRDGQALRYENFTQLSIPFPPEDEQDAIATFLDRETTKIDALVEEQRRLIALLKEKRQAIISHAVTKGLNPDAPMENSGIEWLGEVPAHWMVTAAGRNMQILSGFAFPSEGFSTNPEHTRLLRGVNVGVGRVRWDETVYWPRSPGDGLSAFELSEGELVIGMDRPWIAEGVRIARLSTSDLPCLLLQRVAALRPTKKLDVDYLSLLLSTPAFVEYFTPDMTGVSVPHLSPSQISAFPIPLPSPAEQRAIAVYVQLRTTEADQLIAAAEEAMGLLGERRSALISAAVTGKIDVRVVGKVLPFPVDRARARGLIAAEIIERSAHQANFGRVKLQKIAYLAEAHVGIAELEGAYLREAAGPLDREMIREMEHEACTLAGIRVEQPHGAGSTVIYRPGERHGIHRQDLAALLGDRVTKFDKLLRDIGTIDTKAAEAVATLYAVWNDTLIDGETPADMEIKLAVLTEWHPEKAKKFRLDELQIWLDWMRRHGLVPTGTGPKTSTGRLFA